MERLDLEKYFAHHPNPNCPDPARLLDDCEMEAREYAHRDAWLHAKAVTEDRMRRFERVFGLPASDTFVTREVCHEIARELKSREPTPPKTESAEWISQRFLEALDPGARTMLREWLLTLAAREEHEAWREIVHFTDHLARKLIREQHMTNRADWDFEHSYPRVAARVARMLMREFEEHAKEPMKRPTAGALAH